jgi:hypothetical protein
MKYLIKRNDFLRGAKRLDEKSEFLRDSKIAGNELYQQLIKEDGWGSHGNDGSGSGPMANDIGWHDSLVGRLLNHIVRKVKIANNLRRIKNVVESLKGEFVRLEAEGVAIKMDAEERAQFIKIKIANFFYELKTAVENGEETIIIIGLTEVAITNVELLKDDEIDKVIKDKLETELKEFLEYLKTLKDDEVPTEEGEEGGAQEGGEEEGEEDEGEEDDSYSKLESSIPTMIKNLSALYYILKNYKSVNLLNFNKKEEADAKKPVPYVTVAGDTITSIQLNTEVNKNKLTADQIIDKNKLELKPTLDAAGKTKIPAVKATLPAGLELVLEKQGNSVDGNNVYKEENHLTQAFGKLTKDITSLIDAKDGKLPISAEFIRILLEKHKEGENKTLIMSLYDNINKYLVGNKKQTIQEKDPLYKESYEYLMPKVDKNPNGGKIEVVAEKIARFSKRALQFDGKNLYGGLGELADPLKKFVETLKVLMKNPIVNVKPEYSEQSAVKEKERKYNVGQKYTYTNSKGDKKVVTLVSKTHKMKRGADKKWGTKDDIQMEPRDSKGRYIDVATEPSTVSFQASHSQLSPYVDQKARETKYKKDELIKDIESATKKALELGKTDPEKAKKIQSQIDDKKAQLDKLDESVNESVYISKYMEIQAGMRTIMLELNEALKNNSKPAGRLLKFDRFMSYIKEDNEPATPEETPEPDTASDPRSSMSRVEKIQDWFNKKCMTVKAYTLEEAEYTKVMANFDKLSKDKSAFTIDGYDPIIEILKLFNRAYKLYMVKHISKRKEGAGVSTDSEYTQFGDKCFRNDKIFDVWEFAVQDILKDRKYQFIFDKKTVLRVGDELRPNGGANLRKFMTDMLDGETLYKSKSGYGEGGRGAQATLLDKYFGAPDEADAKGVKAATENAEVEENEKMAKNATENAVKIKTTKISNSINADGTTADFAIRKSYLIIKGTNKDGGLQRTFFVQDIDEKYVYLQYSKTIGSFIKYWDGLDGKKELVDGDGPNYIKDPSKIYYTKIEKRNFNALLLKPGKISIGYIDGEKQEEFQDVIDTQMTYWLTMEKDGKNIVFDTIVSGAAIGTDEAKKKKLVSILESKSKTDAGIKSFIGTKTNVIIKNAPAN